MGNKKATGTQANKGAAPLTTEPTFEQTLAELENLVEIMEGDQVPLGELIENYEKGTLLYEKCQAHLNEAQQRVDLIREGVGEDVKKLEIFSENLPSTERSAQSLANNKTDDGELF